MFTGYYQNNPPGVYFSMPVYLSLLGALLKAGMVSDVFSVLSVSLAHKVLVSVLLIHHAAVHVVVQWRAVHVVFCTGRKDLTGVI